MLKDSLSTFLCLKQKSHMVYDYIEIKLIRNEINNYFFVFLKFIKKINTDYKYNYNSKSSN